MQKRLHAIVSGKVQGVFFRAFAKSIAEKHGVKGIARNTNDGKVEIIAEGSQKQLESFLEEIKKGPPSAMVGHVEAKWENAKNEFEGFRIAH